MSIKFVAIDFETANSRRNSIHGIRPQMVKTAPTFEEVWQEVSGILVSNAV